MPNCPLHSEQFLFLWGFDDEGNPYLDYRIPIKDNTTDSKTIKMIELRAKVQGNVHFALLSLPKGSSVEDLENYIKSAKYDRQRVLEKLKRAKVHLATLFREKSDSNFIEFVHAPDCTCDDCEE